MNPETEPNYRQLRTILVQLYPTIADLRRVASDADVALDRVILGSSILNDWEAVLREAIKQPALLERLLDIALYEYPQNNTLRDVVINFAQYIQVLRISSLPQSNTHLLNFTRTFTQAQQEALELKLGYRLGKILQYPIEFDHAQPYGPQCEALIDSIRLTRDEWETLPIVVNPPGFAPGALGLLSELHGRMGHFPAVVRLRPVVGSNPPKYEFAEVMDLQALRDAARERGKHRP